MISPIRASKLSVTSYYGNRQYTYQGKLVKDFHTGIDLIANPNNRNEDILAVEDGTVTAVSKTGAQYGTPCYVRIRHDNGLYTLYYHMKSGSITVNVGDRVRKGQKIGVIGCTGVATGVHLHFQIDRGTNSSSINPYDYLFNGKEIIDGSSSGGSSGNLYKTHGTMNVRTGAGTNYAIKKVCELTADGKKNATSSDPNANAVYKSGTVFTAIEVVSNNYGTWARTPSGWVCIKGASGTVYCTSMSQSNNSSTGNNGNSKLYKTHGTMNVRTGAGTNYAIKKVSELTADGKKNATSSDPNANAVYKSGTVFTAIEVVSNNYGTWARTPSGWVCIKGASGTVYCSAV